MENPEQIESIKQMQTNLKEFDLGYDTNVHTVLTLMEISGRHIAILLDIDEENIDLFTDNHLKSIGEFDEEEKRLRNNLPDSDRYNKLLNSTKLEVLDWIREGKLLRSNINLENLREDRIKKLEKTLSILQTEMNAINQLNWGS